ncbi:MFS transporter [Streptomyces barkulensis]|uniref:MFS transporter n=1 Tax=Streptomyces barkulensis TaxID=1257026 RepID=UPI001F101791|nr:MFS transporter [Streptomyces barkulensis]
MSVIDTAGARPAEEPPPTRLTPRLRLVLVILLAAQFMLAVDFSILNVALPVIGEGLGFELANLQWIATSFALCAAGFTLLFGRIADLFGRRRLFLGGLLVLGAASLLGGLATSPELLIVARILQGLATAAVTPAGLSLLTTSFPEGTLRDKALGLNGALMSAGFTTGAILGGLLTDLLSWRWAFFVNVPVVAVVLAAAVVVIKESRPEGRPRLDLPGAVTVTLGLLAVVLGLTQAGEHGWTSPVALGSLAAGVALLLLFHAIESRAASPLVPVGVLRRRNVAWGNVAGLIAFLTETSLVFLMTLYLQKVLDFSPLSAGLSFGVLGIGTVIGGSVAPRVVGRIGTRSTLIAGGLLQTAATAALLGLGDDRSWRTPRPTAAERTGASSTDHSGCRCSRLWSRARGRLPGVPAPKGMVASPACPGAAWKQSRTQPTVGQRRWPSDDLPAPAVHNPSSRTSEGKRFQGLWVPPSEASGAVAHVQGHPAVPAGRRRTRRNGGPTLSRHGPGVRELQAVKSLAEATAGTPAAEPRSSPSPSTAGTALRSPCNEQGPGRRPGPSSWSG